MNLDPEQGVQMEEIGKTIVLWFTCSKGQKPLGDMKVHPGQEGATKIPIAKWVGGQTMATKPYLLNSKTSEGNSSLQVWIKQATRTNHKHD